jgi:acetate---CoA ligase (ADP-forming)
VLDGGFTGPVYPVNPRYADIDGMRCAQSPAVLAEPADLVLLAVGAERIEPELRVAADAGARAAVIFGTLRDATTDDRLREITSQAGLVACGANCMGFLNLERSLRACAYAQPPGLPAGPVAFVSHSGSAFSAVAHNDRDARFNLIVSAGTEFSVSMDRYIDYALTLESTRAIGLFMETCRDPAGLHAALAQAADLDIPVVCLKVGRGTRSREFVTTHTGALAGEDAAYDALFDACGVVRVAELDEMMDTLELLTAGRRPGPGGFAAVTDSGGERALLTDLAEDAGVSFAQLDPATVARLGSALSPALVPDNPLDAWDALEGAEDVFAESLRLLHDDPSVAAVGLCVDLTAADDMAYARLASGVHRHTTKPFLVMSHLSSAVSAADAARLRTAGVPLLESTRNGLAAVRNMFRHRDLRARPAVVPAVTDPEKTRRWRIRLALPEPLTVVQSFGLLSDYGIPVVPTLSADSASSAQAAARRIGWPVALKTAAPGIAHKSDAGGVRLGIADPAALAGAYAEMSRALGREVTVSGMVPPGVELGRVSKVDVGVGPH